MSDGPVVVGTAVLRDYPLRLWAHQQEYMQDLTREFTLLLASSREVDGGSAPRRLVEHAEQFDRRFGPLLTQMNDDRQAAYDAGRDRMDLQVPLVEGTREVLEEFQEVMALVDGYCSQGHMLTLARPPELIVFFDWAVSEIVAQYGGAEPTPWPGRF